MKYMVIYIGIINLFTFFMFGIDKYKAKRNLYRISEKGLFLLCFLGGGAGGWIGMFTFRHKIRKWYFNLLVPLSIITTIVIFYKMWEIINK